MHATSYFGRGKQPNLLNSSPAFLSQKVIIFCWFILSSAVTVLEISFRKTSPCLTFLEVANERVSKKSVNIPEQNKAVCFQTKGNLAWKAFSNDFSFGLPPLKSSTVHTFQTSSYVNASSIVKIVWLIYMKSTTKFSVWQKSIHRNPTNAPSVRCSSTCWRLSGEKCTFFDLRYRPFQTWNFKIVGRQTKK